MTSSRKLEGDKYIADQRLAGIDMETSLRFRGVDLDSGRKLQGADLTSSRKLQGDRYTADQRLFGIDLDTARRLQGIDMTSSRKLQGERYTADQRLFGIDLESGRRLQGQRYETDGRVAIADLESGRKLQGEQAKAGADIHAATEDRKARRYAANAGVMQGMGSAAASAKIGLSDAIPEMMRRGYNPTAPGTSNVAAMERYSQREERQAQMAEAGSNTSFWSRRDAQNQAKWASNNKAEDDLRLQREKNRAEGATQQAKGYQDWLSRTLFGG
ncbi:MAG: hypothetical protein HC890_07840 [Chloroflexaceae bacterium]|nr:hypothetical protein [Chloroflexaceae bacterium]